MPEAMVVLQHCSQNRGERALSFLEFNPSREMIRALA
jgi:hypothetical protein